MKLQDLMMQNSKMEQRTMQLQEEVEELQKILDGQQELHKSLQYALHKPLLHHQYFYPSLPQKVQFLVSEIAAIEEEIFYLEERVRELRLFLYHEQKETEESISRNRLQQGHHHQRNSSVLQTRSEPGDLQQSPLKRERKFSWSPCSDARALICGSNFSNLIVRDEEGHRCHNKKDAELCGGKANQLSEELMKCLINIFLSLNRGPSDDPESSATFPKMSPSCMSSRSFISKSSFKTQISLSDDTYPLVDPYDMVAKHDCLPGDFGPYKNFLQFTRNSLNFNKMPHCVSYLEQLRNLLNKLCAVDLRFLTYKEKLAFWINTYNACFMQAFLRYGLPSAPEQLLALMNKAALNVGGIVVNALAIEHFILRCPSNLKTEMMDEKQMLMRHVYGLGYPEPKVLFALCRGSCSSPAVRVYTAVNVLNELETAKEEYLQASIGVTAKRRITLPKLLHWYMHDFASDLESLLEWIYSQLPRNACLKKSIMECLRGERKWPVQKMVEVRPYESEFRYILGL